MMISPLGYIEQLKEADYDTLIKERNNLVDCMVEFERKEKAGDKSDLDYDFCPSPDVVYQVYLEYLSELCKLMHDKYIEDYVFGYPEYLL